MARKHTLLTAQLAAFALVVGTGALAAQSPSFGATAAQSRTTIRLHGDVVPKLSTYQDLGATSSSKHVQLDVTIARPHPAAEAAMYNALYTKGSGHFHDFLTPAQFDHRFGVTKASFDAVRRFATSHGLSLTSAPGSRDLLVLDGSVAQVERTFGVTLHSYRGQGKTFYANTAGPLVPANLHINGVIGLNDLLGSHLYHNGPDNPMPKGTRHGKKPSQDTCLPNGYCAGLTTPQDLWGIYDQQGGQYAKPIGNHKVDFGQGQKMAVFGEGQTAPVISNLRTFEKLHKLPRVPIKVVHTDGTKVSYKDNTGEVEWDLDTQSSTGMSPDVLNETLYFGHDLSDQSVLNVFNAWADDPNGPLQANASYGECEENPVGDQAASTPAAFSAGKMYTLASERSLVKANLEGRTLFSSAGDTGSSCPVVPAATLNGVDNEVIPIVNYPASSPHAVDVGGTVLYGSDITGTHKRAQRELEYPWTYTGGGTSFLFAKPKYQDGIANIAGVCDYSPGGGTGNVGKPCRGAPDVAAQSGDIATNGYGIVAEGETEYPGGGTSLSSPLWMGMWTRIQASAPKVHGRWVGDGFANPALYARFKKHPKDPEFFDVGGTSGKTEPVGNGFYLATPGWDYVSGMGSPFVDDLSAGINGTERPRHPVLPKQAPLPSSKAHGPCSPLFTDASGDDAFPLGMNTGGNPQLDILAGNIGINTGNKSIRTFIRIRNLTKNAASAAGGAPTGSANEYYLLWSYKGKQYFSNVQVDTTTGTVTYGDGTVSGNSYNNTNTNDTGKFITGKNGLVEVNVPLSHVGNPGLGTTLTAPGAQTKVLVGAASTGSLQAADSGGPQYNYTVGRRCN